MFNVVVPALKSISLHLMLLFTIKLDLVAFSNTLFKLSFTEKIEAVASVDVDVIDALPEQVIEFVAFKYCTQHLCHTL